MLPSRVPAHTPGAVKDDAEHAERDGEMNEDGMKRQVQSKSQAGQGKSKARPGVKTEGPRLRTFLDSERRTFLDSGTIRSVYATNSSGHLSVHQEAQCLKMDE